MKSVPAIPVVQMSFERLKSTHAGRLHRGIGILFLVRHARSGRFDVAQRAVGALLSSEQATAGCGGKESAIAPESCWGVLFLLENEM